MEDSLKNRARNKIVLDLRHLNRLGEIEPFMKELSPLVGYFCLSSAILANNSLAAVLLQARVNEVKIVLDLNLNCPPEQMESWANSLKSSGVAMVTIHCSSGPQALQAFVKKMKENTRRFSDEYQVNQDSTFNQPRPLMIGVTIPYYMESTISAMIFGNIGQRLLVLDGYLRQLDGVICRPDNIKSYDKTIRMVTEVVPGEQPLADTQKKKITPAKAIEQGADYLLIREPITSPLPGHTTKSETERILVEIANSLQNRDRLKKVDQPLKPIRRMSVKDENATPPKTAAKKTEKSRETTQEKAPEQAVMAAIDVEKKTSNKPPQRRIFQRPRYLRQLFARS